MYCRASAIDLAQAVHQGAGRIQCAVLYLVRGRRAQRLLQLPRPPSRIEAAQDAIIFEADNGQVTKITYKELYHRVCRFANGLKKLGITKGDRVLIYLPMSIEAVVAMQACARIGAIHSVVFGGFSAKSVQERIIDAKAPAGDHRRRAVPRRQGNPAQAGRRRGPRHGRLRAPSRKVVVYKRTGGEVTWNTAATSGGTTWKRAARRMPADPTWVGAEHPLFILYTSGSTGKPKGVQHSSGGYLLGAS
jgi:acetyl-CoA synthetase